MKFNIKYLINLAYFLAFITLVVSLTRFIYIPSDGNFSPSPAPTFEIVEGLPTPYPDPVFDSSYPGMAVSATWHKKIKSPNLGLWKYQTNDPNAESAIDYYKIGNIIGGEAYDGGEIYIVNLSCEGPCFYPLFYYFIKTKTGFVFLARNSDPLSYAPPGWNNNFTIDTQYELSDLKKYSEKISGHDYLGKHSLKQDTYAKYYFDEVKDLKKIGTDPDFGDIYTNSVYYGEDLTGRELTRFINGLYFKAPDSTIRAYSIVPDFMKESTPIVTWNDGTLNTKDYIFNDIGGCGATNYASIIDESRIKPSDIIPAGKTLNGEVIYDLKDKNHPLLKNIYDTEYNEPYYEGKPNKKPYAEFIKDHPIFFWRDPFGRLIKFQNKDFIIQAECGKPVIYLYPEEKTKVNVQVDPAGGFSKTDPIYPDGGWDVIAEPNGNITSLDDNKNYPYLFWEGRGGIYSEADKGFVIARDEVETFLDDKLSELGLNEKESYDFKEFWLPKMQSANYYKISFYGNSVMNAIAPLSVSPRPDTVIRILMDFKPLDSLEDITPQIIHKPVRKGFVLVEWGGVLR